MPLPQHPVTLNVEQIGELNKKLATFRHNMNNDLSLISAATEMACRKPESAERMWNNVAGKPHKMAKAVAQFICEMEAALGITRP